MCALPSAQLGGLSSLNVPSYIPTVEIRKEPKAWERALLQLLTSAGGAVVSQGVQNAMQPDYDTNPNTGMSKILQGPKTDRAAHVSQQAALDRLQFEIGLRELDSKVSAKDVFAAREKELGEIAAREDASRSRRDSLALGLRGQDTQAAMNDVDNAARIKLAEAQRTFDTPYRNAQITNLGSEVKDRASQAGYRDAQAEEIRSRSQMVKDAMNGGKKSTAGGPVNPNIARFAQEGQTGVPSGPGPEDRLRAMVRQGLTPDQVVQQIQGAQNTEIQNAAQVSAKAAQEDAMVEEIKKRLGLSPSQEFLRPLPGKL